jgi:hypothetical protein
MCMRLIWTWCAAIIPVFTFCLDTNAQENATVVITPSGQILYYSAGDPTSTEELEIELATPRKSDISLDLKSAIEKNTGIRIFF